MREKKKLIILVGPPASGKTTAAESYVASDSTFKVISRDGLRFMYNGHYRMDDQSEKLITRSIQDLVISTLRTHNVLLDATHCQMKYIEDALKKYSEYAKIECLFMPDYTLEELSERNVRRDYAKQVPLKVIKKFRDQYQSLLKSLSEVSELIAFYGEGKHLPKPIKYDIDKQDCILVDIDGTIAHMDDMRKPYDWDKVLLDRPDEVIIELVHDVCNASAHTIPVFVSGRSAECREDTLTWLINQGFENPILFMRGEKDYRKDSIVKKEIYHKHIEPNYNVIFGLDDRQQVVDMYRKELGLKILQVNYGDF